MPAPAEDHVPLHGAPADPAADDGPAAPAGGTAQSTGPGPWQYCHYRCEAGCERCLPQTEGSLWLLGQVPPPRHTPLPLSFRFVDSLVECYHPRAILHKIWPIVWMRCMKVAALFINQLTGRWLCGWNGQENRLYNAVGDRCLSLYQELYGEPVSVTGVRLFVVRRFHLATVVSCVSALQLLAAYLGYPVVVMALALCSTPITLLDRQWCALVTKMIPRFEHDRSLAVCTALAAGLAPAAPALKDFPFRRQVWRRPGEWRAALVFVEALFGAIQMATGAFLLCLTAYALHDPSILSVPLLVQLQFVARVFKNLSNYISALMLWYLAPQFYASASRQIHDFLGAVAKAVPVDEVPSSDAQQADGTRLAAARKEVAQTQFLAAEFGPSPHVQRIWTAGAP
eukprot:EG_transcript_9272